MIVGLGAVHGVSEPLDPDPSGKPMVTEDLPSWALLWADNFAGLAVPYGNFPDDAPGWSAYGDGWPDTNKRNGHEGGEYWPSKVVGIWGGIMNLHLQTEAGVHMVAAPEPFWGIGRLYGLYAVRWRIVEPLPGYKTAWMLWPVSGEWPRDGEIDFPEGDIDGRDTIHGFMHRQDACSTCYADQYAVNTGAIEADGEWHTSVIVWAPDLLQFRLDGEVVGSTTYRVPNTGMRWVLQTETALYPAPPPSDATEGNVQIDWVAIWRLK
jgi:hypothetical protein